MISDETKILFSMLDFFDYEEYLNKCAQEQIQPMIKGIFAQKIGMVALAHRLNINNPEQGYLDLIADMNKAYNLNNSKIVNKIPQPINVDNIKKPCGGCGGGEVR